MYAKILDYCLMLYNTLKQEKMPRVLLRVGFDKAFDSISWSFIQKDLEFNFGPGMKKGIKTFHKNASTCVQVNSH